MSLDSAILAYILQDYSSIFVCVQMLLYMILDLWSASYVILGFLQNMSPFFHIFYFLMQIFCREIVFSRRVIKYLVYLKHFDNLYKKNLVLYRAAAFGRTGILPL